MIPTRIGGYVPCSRGGAVEKSPGNCGLDSDGGGGGGRSGIIPSCAYETGAYLWGKLGHVVVVVVVIIIIVAGTRRSDIFIRSRLLFLFPR